MSLPRLFKPFQQHREECLPSELSAWFETAPGAAVLAHEQLLLEQVLSTLYGFYMVQVSMGPILDLRSASPIPNQCCVVAHDAGATAAKGVIRSRLDEMALATESVDAMLLHHCLDFHPAPHRVLREVARTIVPGGKLVIVGFNPYSLWGFMHFFRGAGASVPWSGNFISPFRVADWLKVLDFQTEGYECACHMPPVKTNGSRRMLGWLDRLGPRIWPQTGGVYVMVATRQVCPLTPSKPILSTVRDRLVPIPLAGIANPSTRNPDTGR